MKARPTLKPLLHVQGEKPKEPGSMSPLRDMTLYIDVTLGTKRVEQSKQGGCAMAQQVAAVKTADVPVDGITAVDAAGKRIAVANAGGTYYAFDDECTHEQCSLAEYGEIAGTTLTCTCHGSEFDVATGKVLAPPAQTPLTVYRTRVEGDALKIEL